MRGPAWDTGEGCSRAHVLQAWLRACPFIAQRTVTQSSGLHSLLATCGHSSCGSPAEGKPQPPLSL